MQIKKEPYILGLDIGPNSIGWAVVDCRLEENPRQHQGIYAGYQPTSLRALNSRIFLDMLDAKTRVPKNQKRRAARGTRSRRSYYKERRKELVDILLEAGLLPACYYKNPQQTLTDIDRNYAKRKAGKTWSNSWTSTEKSYCSPYAMRNFALEEKLEPHELGRLLLHLQRRRGYFSNRGAKYIELIKSLNFSAPKDDENAMDSEEKKETGKVLAAIDKLDSELNRRTLTLGQFIWQKSKERAIPPQRITLFEFEKPRQYQGETIVERLQFRARREMYEQEFGAIRAKQQPFHKLNATQWEQIKRTIFHQRPLQLQKGAVGNCNIYPEKKRSALMRLEYQEFRSLQMINNLKINDEILTAQQRQELLSLTNDPTKLNKSGRIAWKDVAKHLGKPLKALNYSQGGDDGAGKTGLSGNKTAQAISASIGVEAWKALDKTEQAKLVEDILTIHNKKTLYQRLVNHWKFRAYQTGDDADKEGALNLTMNEAIEDGYGKHSLKAVNALLPHLHDGKNYYDAVDAIGERESITKSHEAMNGAALLDINDVPNIGNPVVQKALYEIRRVVNSIIKRYGKPAIIRIEMAREMQSSKKHRKEIESQQKVNRKRNEDAEKAILEYHKNDDPNIRLEQLSSGNVRVSITDRNKYKMWKFEQKEKCPYCQKPIGFDELFSGEAEIEHILPYTGFRQSYMNTVVSCRSCNAYKGQRTPYEAWGHDPARWKRIEKFAEAHYSKLPIKKRNILKKKHQPEAINDFVERQLNDTRYIATASKKMLEKYGVPIDVNNGATTNELRRHLGLNNILPRKPDASVYTETGEKVDVSTGEILRFSADKAGKSRHDHRHHAVDAFVVAMTDRAMLKAMVETHKQEQENKPSRSKTREEYIKERRLQLPKSWQNDTNLHFLLHRKLNATVVSHMTKRKVWGALHEETLYGKSYFE